MSHARTASKNPFRRPSPPLPPLPQRTPSPELPPVPSEPEMSRRTPPAAADIDDDLPPPYTPAANVGEQTVGLGPRRPFQQAPLIPPQSLLPPPDQRPYANWPSQPVPGPSSGLAPWQTQQQYRQRQKTGGGLIGALIDTVRDIADVVSGAHDERLMAAQSANVGAYANQYAGAPSTYSAYAPPPGPPGQYQPPPAPAPASAPPPPRPVSAPPQSSPPIPDDGSPTRTPVPGHPLLLEGNLLVYPKDHLCVKCKNTGYKNYDPSHPCRKCWEKYGRPYTGALTYTPWAASGNDPRMQRALPRFVPPHLAGGGAACAGSSRSREFLPPPQHPQHHRSISQPHHSSGAGSSYYVVHPLLPYEPPPVPDAIPVEPGDPRLGGRLCNHCGGAGVQPVGLFDTTMCDNCGGTGRVWR